MEKDECKRDRYEGLTEEQMAELINDVVWDERGWDDDVERDYD